MIRHFILFAFIGISAVCHAQQFSGQWKGEFIDKSTSRAGFLGEKCDYVLELDVKGDEITGSSYTYYTESGKKYYTICKVLGQIDMKRKWVEIKEVERTKTNIPIHIRNCFQVHKLTYFKQGDVETIEGKWVPAPNQKGNCGFGNTMLTRRTLINQYPTAYAKAKTAGENGKLSVTQNNKNNQKTPSSQVPKPTKNAASLLQSKEEKIVVIDPIQDQNPTEIIKIEKQENTNYTSKLEGRKNAILKTIEVESKIIKIDLYDNGEIDGDSISLFFNGKLLLTNKKLTDKSISLMLPIDDENAMNELVMYAENLGLIAPNTALMVVTDGPNRYEIRITSDLEKSGTIRIVRKSRKP
jgi:hypothetical protein